MHFSKITQTLNGHKYAHNIPRKVTLKRKTKNLLQVLSISHVYPPKKYFNWYSVLLQGYPQNTRLCTWLWFLHFPPSNCNKIPSPKKETIKKKKNSNNFFLLFLKKKKIYQYRIVRIFPQTNLVGGFFFFFSSYKVLNLFQV